MGLISIVFGYEKPTTRNAESLELLRWGYANYKLDRVVAKGTIVDSVDHILYKNRINIIVKEDIYHLTSRKDQIEYQVKYEYEIKENSCTGTAQVYLKNELLKTGELMTEDSVEKKNFIELMFSILKSCFL